MNASAFRPVPGIALVLLLSLARSSAAPQLNKALRVDHGRPVVVVSQKSVLVLEFLEEPIADALVAHPEPEIRHCRARYRFRGYDRATGSVTNGQGTVEEIYRAVPGTGGTQVVDQGSRVGIGAGDFYLWWSQASAGTRSWVNYRAESPIRFIQQPRDVAFDSVDRELLHRYLSSRNVQEFVATGRMVQVTGPSVFEGDLPADRPASGRIESVRWQDRVLEMRLADLAVNQHYVIESSYEARSDAWTAVNTFIAAEPTHTWSETVGAEVDVLFYRIRQGI